MLKQTFTWEGAARRRDRRDLENFYYEVIYALLQTPIEHAIKAKITRLHHEEQRSRHLYNDDRDRLEGENTTLYNILKTRKRQESKSVQIVYDEEGVPQTKKVGILKTFRKYMYKKLGNITIEYDSLRRLLDGRHNILPNEATEAIDASITMDELKRAVQKGKPNKAPGWDRISNDFFKIMWDAIKHELLEVVNEMYRDGQISENQKHANDSLCSKKPPTNENGRLPTPDIAEH
jgi:hypothetical protein